MDLVMDEMDGIEASKAILLENPEAKILKMAITAASDTNQTMAPIPPCGSCRQSMAEYEIKQETPIEIYFMGEIGAIYKSESLKNLLPFMFDKKFL